jgi:hypothetical protein
MKSGGGSVALNSASVYSESYGASVLVNCVGKFSEVGEMLGDMRDMLMDTEIFYSLESLCVDLRHFLRPFHFSTLIYRMEGAGIILVR